MDIADKLMESYENSDGRKVSGNAALLHNIKEYGGLRDTVDIIERATISAVIDEIAIAEMDAKRNRSNIRKIG